MYEWHHYNLQAHKHCLQAVVGPARFSWGGGGGGLALLGELWARQMHETSQPNTLPDDGCLQQNSKYLMLLFAIELVLAAALN